MFKGFIKRPLNWKRGLAIGTAASIIAFIASTIIDRSLSFRLTLCAGLFVGNFIVNLFIKD